MLNLRAGKRHSAWQPVSQRNERPIICQDRVRTNTSKHQQTNGVIFR